MDTLDNLVINGLSERLLTLHRLRGILAFITRAHAAEAAEVDARVTRLTQGVHETETRLERFFIMVKDGVAEMDDILRDRINSLQLDRDRIQSSLDQIRTHAIPTDAIPEPIIAEFGSIMWENIANGDIPFRKARLKSIADDVIVDDKHIRINGSKHTMTGGKNLPNCP